jgi:hypothetical protein
VRRLTTCAAIALTLSVTSVAPAGAARTPDGTEYHPIAFPVREAVTYFDDFGGVRDHHGNDLMGKKLYQLLAADDGVIAWVRTDRTRRSGNMLALTGDDGWKYWYLHINDDTPGTDDGANPARWRFAPGIAPGVRVQRGQFIAYMGDSGEAEPTQPHLHFEIHRPDDSYINPYASLRLAQGAGAGGLCRYPTNPAPRPDPAAGRGFWTLTGAGRVLGFGNVQTYGNAPATTPLNSYVGLAPTPTANGYWIVDAAGNVRAFGGARAYGGTAGLRLNAPIIGIAGTPTGRGYWLLGRDGGIFTFGDARFYGSTGSMRLNAPIIAMAATATGRGYWLLGRDGGIFTFGDARFYGSTGSMRLNAPVLSMAVTPTGRGYWLVARDGGMFTFGDARFRGSIPGTGWCPGPATLAMARTATGGGYWILLDDGRVVAFGDANPWGQPAALGVRAATLVAAP